MDRGRNKKVEKLSYETIVRELNERIGGVLRNVCFDEQEKHEVLKTLILYGHMSRRLCRTDADYWQFVKDIMDDFAEIDTEYGVMPRIKVKKEE